MFFLLGDDSIDVCDNMSIDCEGCEQDSLTYVGDYACFNFWEDDSFEWCGNGLMDDGDEVSFYSCEDEFDECDTLEFGDERRRSDKEGVMQVREVVTFRNFIVGVVSENALSEVKMGSEDVIVHWGALSGKIIEGGGEMKSKRKCKLSLSD